MKTEAVFCFLSGEKIKKYKMIFKKPTVVRTIVRKHSEFICIGTIL